LPSVSGATNRATLELLDTEEPMTGQERTEIISKLVELRAAIPIRGTRPQDLVPFNRLAELWKLIEAVEVEVIHPVLLATADTDLGLVPASTAKAEAEKIASATGKTVTVRDPVSDKVIATVKPMGVLYDRTDPNRNFDGIERSVSVG
jgi:hypothetical protein